jgi:hypothetical protein
MEMCECVTVFVCVCVREGDEMCMRSGEGRVTREDIGSRVIHAIKSLLFLFPSKFMICIAYKTICDIVAR